MREAQQELMIRNAADWVQALGTIRMTIQYGCQCGRYPLKSGDFFRMSSEKQAGATWVKGFWVTCCYLNKWNWGSDGRKRLFIVDKDTEFLRPTWASQRPTKKQTCSC